MALSIRARLTLWYTVVLSVFLFVFGAGLYVADLQMRLAQLDGELARGCSTVASLVGKELDEGSDLPTAAGEAEEDFPADGQSFAAYDPGGSLLTQPPEVGLGALTTADLAAKGSVSRSIPTSKGDWRLHVQRFEHGTSVFYVAGAQPLAPVHEGHAILGRALTIGIPIALALAGAGGWVIARRALRPVAVMVKQARQITDRTSEARLSVANPHDELGRLAEAFNDLLGRLEGALRTQRAFMADASHELRTPLSVARTATDVTLSQERPAEEYRDAPVIVARQVHRLERMVEDMFTLARADVGALRTEPTDFYFDELVAECVGEAMVLARERQIDIRCHDPQDVGFRGDERLLRQMLLNLLHNAVRHTPVGGHIDVRLAVDGAALEVEVTDTGGGIPMADRDRIFERFVRLDAARGPEGGAGLGLAIARSIAAAHGGTLQLAQSGVSGSTFVVLLPRPDAPP